MADILNALPAAVDGYPLVVDGWDRVPQGRQWFSVSRTAPRWSHVHECEVPWTTITFTGPREGEANDALWQVSLAGAEPTVEQIIDAALLAVAEYREHGDSYTGACSTVIDVAGTS